MLSTAYKVYLTLIITIVTTSAAAAQEARAYRVEVLLLRNLEATTEPKTATEPLDFTTALDLGAQAANSPGPAEDPFYLGPPDSELRPPAGPFPDGKGPRGDIRRLTQRSERMNTVWRNLRLSGEFRPETFLAWEQPAEPPFPLLRVHNEEIVAVDDPWAPTRVARSEYVFVYDLENGALRLAPIPAPEYHYALDGSVRLRRSRFLHIDLDLAYRSSVPAATARNFGPPLLPAYQGYQAHRLKQSRQVRTGRMEYFDSPALGALVWVSEIESQEKGSSE